MILYLTIKQSNNIYWIIFEGIIFLFCVISNHMIQYILYKNLEKEEINNEIDKNYSFR